MSPLENLRRIAAHPLPSQKPDAFVRPVSQSDARWLLEHIESLERAMQGAIPAPVLKSSGLRLAPVAVELSRPEGAA
jgi:hypothetical protein